MNRSYPVTLKRYRGAQVGAFFADVPEAITAGTHGAEALDRVQDALLVALSGYLDDGRPLPRPSMAKRGQPEDGADRHFAAKSKRSHCGKSTPSTVRNQPRQQLAPPFQNRAIRPLSC